MKKSPAQIFFRLPQSEKDKLEAYCEATGREKTDVLREAIRALPEVPAQVA